MILEITLQFFEHIRAKLDCINGVGPACMALQFLQIFLHSHSLRACYILIIRGRKDEVVRRKAVSVSPSAPGERGSNQIYPTSKLSSNGDLLSQIFAEIFNRHSATSTSVPSALMQHKAWRFNRVRKVFVRLRQCRID